MMAGVRIDSPLMSRTVVEVFDIIADVTVELGMQRKFIDRLYELWCMEVGHQNGDQVAELLAGLKESSDHCSRVLM